MIHDIFFTVVYIMKHYFGYKIYTVNNTLKQKNLKGIEYLQSKNLILVKFFKIHVQYFIKIYNSLILICLDKTCSCK